MRGWEAEVRMLREEMQMQNQMLEATPLATHLALQLAQATLRALGPDPSPDSAWL